ncbi:MAG: DNA mismatch repair endonuclease MutL [Lachnospiraceae bacterium]
MPNIQVLDQNTINKIAAGEVIERPASVVKELLENAIDARSTAITVEIRDGGISLIRVTDNGCGIPREELPLAFLRHSTSKIKAVEDLFTISSLGFRGEALSSIAAVSQVEVITKTPDSLTGTRYQIEGGEEKTLEEIGAPDGTTFIARNLFFNTPVRRKFLKTAATEGAHVAGIVEKIALSHPEVSVRFIQNHQNKLHTSGNHSMKDIIYTLFGREIAANLLPVEQQQDGVQVSGFIGKPVINRNNRNYEHYFINGRYIKSSIIGKAIEEAYKPFMMQHKYPFTMLHFTIEPDFLDVNVHPTKMELRFRDGELIFRMVRDSISAALQYKELIPEVNLVPAKETSVSPEKRIPVPEPFERKRMELLHITPPPVYPEQVREPQASYGIPREAGPTESRLKPQSPMMHGQTFRPAVQPQLQQPEESVQIPPVEELPVSEPPKETREVTAQLDLFAEKLLEPKARSRHKLIGQLFATYWMVEFNEQLYIIDQHAAHEKVLYEKTMATLKTREYTCQMIHPPIILTLNSNEEILLKKHLNYFTDIGFEIEHFGGREYAVRGVPDNLFAIAKKELLMEMIDELSDDASMRDADVIYERVASMSCKAAVKGNHTLSAQEADELIDQLLDLENPYACPHGRPTIISMSKYELEKKFKRIV